VLAVLATQAHARGDLGEAAGWLSRQLSVAAERQRTDPISTLAPIVMLVPVAAGLGRVEEAVRLRESIATMDPLIRTSIPPELFAPYEAVVEGLRRQVPLAAYEQWSRESAGMSLSQANRQPSRSPGRWPRLPVRRHLRRPHHLRSQWPSLAGPSPSR